MTERSSRTVFWRRLARIGLTVVLAGVAWTHAAHAQSATLRGFVTDASSQQPLDLVHVVLERVDGDDRQGTTSGTDGVYVFSRIDPGRYVLQASFIGFQAYRDTLALEAGETRHLNIELQPGAAGLDELVVEDESVGGVARVLAGQQTIRAAEVELIPAPDLSADLVGYLTSMPSVVTTGDRGGQLFIRGGEPSHNRILLDGVPVYQPFHMVGFYSAFPADVIQKADLYAGGYGAEYGGRLSSVLDVRTRTGNNQRFVGQATVAPFIGSVQVEGPIVPGRVSMLVSGRRSLLDQTEHLTGVDLPIQFHDVMAKLDASPSEVTRLSMTALQTRDRGVIVTGDDEADTDQLEWSNTAIGARAVTFPSDRPFLGELEVGYAALESEQHASEGIRSSAVRELRVAAMGTFFGTYLSTLVGLELNMISLESQLGGLFQNTFSEASRLYEMAMIVSPELTPGWGLSIRPGVRLQFYDNDDLPHVEPRLRIVWERGRHQLSAAAGFYQQEVVGVSDQRDATGVFTAWTYAPGIGARPDGERSREISKARHVLLGYRVTPLDGLDLSVEGYHKDIDNIFVAEWTPAPRLTTNVQTAAGRTYGFDVRASFERGAFHGEATYGYVNSEYEVSRDRYVYWYGSETLSYRPPHDRRHQVGALVGTRLLGFDLSLRWQFGSGRPFSRALGFGGFILMDSVDVDLTQQGTRRVHYDEPYNAQLPTYHRLDVSLERTFDWRWMSLTLQASAINAYDRRNIFYFDVFTLERADQLPFVPSVGLRIRTR